MKRLALLLGIITLVSVPGSLAQSTAGPSTAGQTPTTSAPKKTKKKAKKAPRPDPTIVTTIDAMESEEEDYKRQLVSWNHYEGPYFTARFGGGFLYEFGAFAQDANSKQQFTLHPEDKLRDFRFLFGGKLLPKIMKKRTLTYSVGVMYDAPNRAWRMRQTGVMIAVPELWGYFFVGRTKEGFSLNKVMVGYDGWTMERSTMNDATVPLLADGIKWMGYLPRSGFGWNVGYFNDVLSKGQSFSSYGSQEVARLMWLPIRSPSESHSLLHLGVNLQWGKPTDGKLQLRSRPESFTAPYFLDTGKFSASSTFMYGGEAYYRRRSWLFGSEYWAENINSPSTRNPTVHGGDVVATWLLTGETRTYNTVGGFFRAVSPERPVFQGGRGAWELVFRQSYTDLDSGTLRGGRFWRFTPMLNWYLSDNVRLEFAYGYGHLNRFGLPGNTQFFQTRLQLQL